MINVVVLMFVSSICFVIHLSRRHAFSETDLFSMVKKDRIFVIASILPETRSGRGDWIHD
jgi:hypothetical protein